MQISTSGGTPEEVLTQRFVPSILHYVDSDYYYIHDIASYYDYERSLTLIDRKSEEITTDILPEGYGVDSVHIYRDKPTSFAPSAYRRQNMKPSRRSPLRAYRFREGEYELLAENRINYTFADGAFWYTPFELEYYRTVMSHTDKGSETPPHDIIRNSGNTLTRVDLADGNTKTCSVNGTNEP